VKARAHPLRWPIVTLPIWTLALAIGTATTTAESPRRGRLAAPQPARNAITLSPAMNIPHFAITLAYDRVLHRRVTLGGRFEYAVPRRGFGQLAGWAEGIALAIWAPRAFHGFFAQADLLVAHTVLAVQSRLHTVAVVPGLTAGFRVRLGRTFFLGASAGLRWGATVRREPAICTLSPACPAVRTGPRARVTADFGFAF